MAAASGAEVMDHYDNDGYRSNVGIILVREGQLLLGGAPGRLAGSFPKVVCR